MSFTRSPTEAAAALTALSARASESSNHSCSRATYSSTGPRAYPRNTTSNFLGPSASVLLIGRDSLLSGFTAPLIVTEYPQNQANGASTSGQPQRPPTAVGTGDIPDRPFPGHL